MAGLRIYRPTTDCSVPGSSAPSRQPAARAGRGCVPAGVPAPGRWFTGTEESILSRERSDRTEGHSVVTTRPSHEAERWIRAKARDTLTGKYGGREARPWPS